MRENRFCSFLWALISLPVLSYSAVTISVNSAISYQVIDGFGAMADTRESPEDYVQNFGASISRLEIMPNFNTTEGAPLNCDADAEHFEYFKSLVAVGHSRFIGTVWSPPCWMKISDTCENGSSLKAGMEDTYATFLCDYAKLFRDSVGVELYGMSVQNEPQFKEFYNSNIMNCFQMQTVINLLVPKLRAAGLHTKIYGAEHMFGNMTITYGCLLSDSLTRSHMHAFAVHGYTNGEIADYGTPTSWSTLYETVSQKGLRLWMTETEPIYDSSGFIVAHSLMETGRTLHTALKYGKISEWTWWSLVNGLLLRPPYYASKHYFKFVHPEAQMIDCNSSLSTVWSTAFFNTVEQTMAIILVNNGPAVTAHLEGTVASQMQRSESIAPAGRCTVKDTIFSSNDFALPESSITTLYGAYTVPVIHHPKGSASSLGLAISTISRIYDMRGKVIKGAKAYIDKNGNVRINSVARGARIPHGMYRAVAITKSGTRITQKVLIE